MKLPLGIGMILIGGILFHIASSAANPANIRDIWADILNVMGNNDLPSKDSGGYGWGGADIGPIGGNSSVTPSSAPSTDNGDGLSA